MGGIWPQAGIAVKPLADGFIALIKLSITPLIFLVVATGVAQVGDMRKVGRIGLKTLIYFEIITTIALLMGAIVGNVVNFGAAVQRPSATQAASAARYANAHAQSLSEFLFAMVPENLFGAFVHDNVLQVLVIALMVGAAMVRLGETRRDDSPGNGALHKPGLRSGQHHRDGRSHWRLRRARIHGRPLRRSHALRSGHVRRDRMAHAGLADVCRLRRGMQIWLASACSISWDASRMSCWW